MAANTVLLLAALAAMCAGFLGTAGTPAQTPEAKGPADAAKGAKDAEPSKTFEVQGRVLGPDGKPAANAEVFVCARWAVASDAQKDKGEKLPSPRAITDADGKYRFSATQAEMNQHVSVVAAAKDLGPDWVPLTRLNRGGGLPDLRLVKDDIPITGRVLDLESQPVAGATVNVLRVMKAPGENLWPFFGARSRGYEEGVMTSLEMSREVKTGADGKFTLAGFGHDRVVVLVIESPDLERRVAEVITRTAVPKGVPVVCAAKADYLLAPAKPIAGVVRDKGTGKPVAGVKVTGFTPQSVEPDRATTDEKGRYRLAGVAKSNTGYYLLAQGAPFVRTARLVNDTPGLEAVTADFDLQRGLEVRGRLIDKSTGRPVRGFVEYHASVDNPNLKDFPSYTKLVIEDLEVSTQPDGSFSMTVLPGQGVIYARSWENRFTNAWSWPAVSVDVSPFPWGRESYHAAVEIDASEKNPKSLICQIALDPGQTLAGTVVGPDGKPLTGVLAWGLAPAFGKYDLQLGLPTLRMATFTATGLDDRNPRYMLFWHKEKGLGRAVLVWGDERGPITLHLEPLGTVTGRLVDEEGKPLAGITVNADWSSARRGIYRQFSGLVTGNHLQPEGLFWQTVKTDGEGRFQMPRLIPGFSYELRTDANARLTKNLPAPTGGVPKDLGTITIATKKRETKKP
jgi:protocatechuate 3,4-dioxygenase beta subunit